MRLLRLYAAAATALLLVVAVAGFGRGIHTAVFDEITVSKINVVDSEGRTRVLLAGGYPPRRADLAGLLFINQDGVEAGGLVYRGTQDTVGGIQAGAILTFDQYGNDQIVALSYDHDGGRKRQGLTIQERPDTLSDLVKEAYRAIETAPSAAERDSLTKHYLAMIPQQDLVSRRLFVGRTYDRASVVTLSDPAGNPRLRLVVDSLGAASISFLDEQGQVVRTITP
ncbi:MAG: hypothetical protein JJE01_01140 [Gemmatimonadetes bacterium]|nr:hypothetical protein [Gemmatimonadota bacterium]